jgi:hypothetical protein
VVGEVTTLEHELGDDAVERRSLVSESLLASAKGAEVLGSLGNYVLVQLEGDAAEGSCSRANSVRPRIKWFAIEFRKDLPPLAETSK